MKKLLLVCGLIINAFSISAQNCSVGGTLSGNTTVCSGANSGTLTLSGQVGEILRWESSHDNFNSVTSIMNTTTSYTYMNLSSVTQFRVVVKSGGCDSVYSAVATVTVNPVTVGGTVSGAATVCEGNNSGILNLIGHTGNIIKWESSTNNFASVTVITNTSSSIVYSNLTQSTHFKAVVKSGVCSSANSNAVFITVNPKPNAGSATVTASPICSGSTTTLALSGQVGTVQWQDSTEEKTWMNVIGGSGGTSSLYTTPKLNKNHYYRIKVVSGICSTVISNVVMVKVDSITIGGIATSNVSRVCENSSATVNLTNYLGSIQWQSSSDGIWSDVIGGLGGTSETYTTASLTDTIYYRAIVKNGVCAAAISTPVKILVDAVTQSGALSAYPNIICSGNKSQLTLSGSNGNIQWQSSNDGSTSWVDILGENTSTYISPNLTQTIYYRTLGTNGVCSSVNSNVVKVEVSPISKGGTVSAIQSTVCYGNSTELNVTGFVGVIQWQVFQDGIAWTDIAGANSLSYKTPLLTQNTFYRIAAASGGCSAAISTETKISVALKPTVAHAGIDTSSCRSSINLQGNAPISGIGTWTIFEGLGGAITYSNSPFSLFSGQPGTTYLLGWSISQPGCFLTIDTVKVTFFNYPKISFSGTDHIVCSSPTKLNVSATPDAVGEWTVKYGSGKLENPNSLNTTVSGLGLGMNIFKWTMTNSPCPYTVDSISIYYGECKDVWPGDANTDGVADWKDAFPLALNYSYSGTPRSESNILWKASTGVDWWYWSDKTNPKHSDCDGNGTVEAKDALAILKNYSLTHNKTEEILESAAGNPELAVINLAYSGDFLTGEIWAGNSSMPVNNLYGVGFRLAFNPLLFESGSAELTFNNSFFADPAANSISIDTSLQNESFVDAVIIRTDKKQLSGYGKIADLKIKFKNPRLVDVSPGLIFQDYKAVNSNGDDIVLNTVNADYVGVKEMNEEHNIRVVESMNGTYLVESQHQKINEIEVVNLLGAALFKNTDVNENTSIVKLDVIPGIYIVKVRSGQSIVTKKIFVK